MCRPPRVAATLNEAPVSHLFHQSHRTLNGCANVTRDNEGLHGKRKERDVFKFIDNYENLYENDYKTFTACSYEHRVSVRQIYRWAKHRKFYGEMPFETRRFYAKLKRKAGYFHVRANIFTQRPDLLIILQQILTAHPEFYLDQFVEALYEASDVLVSPCTVYRTLHDVLGYRLLRVQEIASNRSEDDRELFKQALLGVLERPELLVTVDETSKDRNASRRLRAWGERGRKLEIAR